MDDFTPAVRSSLAAVFAAQAGVDVDRVSVAVTSASVRVAVTIAAQDDDDGIAIATNVGAAMPNSTAASTFVGLQVTSTPDIALIVVQAPALPPPSPRTPAPRPTNGTGGGQDGTLPDSDSSSTDMATIGAIGGGAVVALLVVILGVRCVLNRGKRGAGLVDVQARPVMQQRGESHTSSKAVPRLQATPSTMRGGDKPAQFSDETALHFGKTHDYI